MLSFKVRAKALKMTIFGINNHNFTIFNRFARGVRIDLNKIQLDLLSNSMALAPFLCLNNPFKLYSQNTSYSPRHPSSQFKLNLLIKYKITFPQFYMTCCAL